MERLGSKIEVQNKSRREARTFLSWASHIHYLLVIVKICHGLVLGDEAAIFRVPYKGVLNGHSVRIIATHPDSLHLETPGHYVDWW